MKTQLLSSDYLEYQNRLRLHLAKYLEADSIKLEELLAILETLSGSENLDEFKSLVGIFAKSFPVLKDFLDKESEQFTETNEKLLSDITKKLINDGKSELANKIAKENLPIAEITEKYPELKNYL
jgi:two-component SAPR family response regulator